MTENPARDGRVVARARKRPELSPRKKTFTSILPLPSVCLTDDSPNNPVKDAPQGGRTTWSELRES